MGERNSTVKNLLEANKAVKKLNLQHYDWFKQILEFQNIFKFLCTETLPKQIYLVFLCGNNRAVPIIWKSKNLERVSKSPTT